jgi:23S rRNA G2069 N7-methylase RlmK/C1962 C5-methylase RlmI
VLEPGGLLAACSSTLKLAAEDLDRAVGEGAARARASLAVVERRSLPPDFPVPPGFPEANYLKFLLCYRG